MAANHVAPAILPQNAAQPPDANELAKRMELARQIVSRDLFNRQEAAKTYSVVSALFATLPFAAVILLISNASQEFNAKIATLRALSSITSMWTVCATVGYTLQLLLVGDWIQLLEMKASPRAISESRFKLSTLMLWRATEWLFRFSLLGLIGIFVCSCWATLEAGAARWVALAFALATGVCSLWMVLIVFPDSAHGTYMAKHAAAAKWEAYTQAYQSTTYGQWELFCHGFMCGPLPGVVDCSGSLLAEDKRRQALSHRSDYNVALGDPPPLAAPASQEMRIKNWDPDGKSWSEWNVRPVLSSFISFSV